MLELAGVFVCLGTFFCLSCWYIAHTVPKIRAAVGEAIAEEVRCGLESARYQAEQDRDSEAWV